MALRKIPMTMQDWETLLNQKYRIVQDRLLESDFDGVVTETKRLGEAAAKATSRNGEKP